MFYLKLAFLLSALQAIELFTNSNLFLFSDATANGTFIREKFWTQGGPSCLTNLYDLANSFYYISKNVTAAYNIENGIDLKDENGTISSYTILNGILS
jgi:hypothetical protein